MKISELIFVFLIIVLPWTLISVMSGGGQEGSWESTRYGGASRPYNGY